MYQLQIAFNEVDEKKNILGSLKSMIKEQIENREDYKKIVDDLDAVKTKKKQLEAKVKQENEEDVRKILELEQDIKEENKKVSDLALIDYLAGKKIEVTDKKGNILEPKLSVRLIKSGKKIKKDLPEMYQR